MKRFLILLIVLIGAAAACLLTLLQVNHTPNKQIPLNTAEFNSSAESKVREARYNLPMMFEANYGQANEQFKFIARSPNYTVSLLSNSVQISLRKPLPKDAVQHNSRSSGSKNNLEFSNLHMEFIEANPSPEIIPIEESSGKSNYFIGNDPAKWRTDIPNYKRIKYVDIYPGIDLIFYGNQRQLEHDFIVKPGADPSKIKFKFPEDVKIKINAQNDLQLESGTGSVVFRSPQIYQEISGTQKLIAGEYIFNKNNEIQFSVDNYDPKANLVIDPVLIYSTYLGGSGYEYCTDIAVDKQGNAYITGSTFSNDFPVVNAFQNTLKGYDIFVSKFNAEGTQLVYSTFVGSAGSDNGNAIALDDAGNAYVVGTSSSSSYSNDEPFPTVNAFQDTNFGGNYGYEGNTVLFKLGQDGNKLLYSTYFGNDGKWQNGCDIAVDKQGNAYVLGSLYIDYSERDFPLRNGFVTEPYFNGFSFNYFVAKFDPSKSGDASLIYSSWLGGKWDDGYNYRSGAIAVDAEGYAYVTGETYSTDFPVKNAFQEKNNGGRDAFVTKIDKSGSSIIYSTFIGGTEDDHGNDIAVDKEGYAYVLGYGGAGFPKTNGAFSDPKSISFLSKLNKDGNALIYSAAPIAGSYKLIVDDEGSAYVGGMNAVLRNMRVAKYNTDGTDTLFTESVGDSSMCSSLALDESGNIYLAGNTTSKNFPVVNAYQPQLKGGQDIVVVKLKHSTVSVREVGV
ncbi:MAG: SBBP repeat-containing protein, partial [Bacillota bacterium]